MHNKELKNVEPFLFVACSWENQLNPFEQPYTYAYIAYTRWRKEGSILLMLLLMFFSVVVAIVLNVCVCVCIYIVPTMNDIGTQI